MEKQRKNTPLIVKIFKHAAYTALGCGCIYAAARGENPLAGLVAMHFFMKGLEDPAFAAVEFTQNLPLHVHNLKKSVHEKIGRLPHNIEEIGGMVHGFSDALTNRRIKTIRSFIQAGRNLTASAKAAYSSASISFRENYAVLKEIIHDFRHPETLNKPDDSLKSGHGANVIPFPQKHEDNYPDSRSGAFFRRRGAQTKCKKGPSREDVKSPAVSSKLLENSV